MPQKSEIPPTAVGGCSDPTFSPKVLKRLNNLARFFLRQDLNNPPTAVGGIQDASSNRCL